MLIRVTNEFGAGFTIYVEKAHSQRVFEDYRDMGYTIRVL